MTRLPRRTHVRNASQGYDTKASAEKGIESVKANGPGTKVVELTEREPAHH
ncbi:MAG: YegP family protein [Mycobacterium sp.]|uniref:YegP family protein n=1 Tax=Mycobacterium sp. TaxID=1785 RepID=UPI003F95F9F1